jgi:hypothetical protein
VEQLCYCYCWSVVILSAAKDLEEFNSPLPLEHFIQQVFAVFHTRPKNKSQKDENFKLEKERL